MKTSTNKSILALATWLAFAPVLYPSSIEASECIMAGETKLATIKFAGETQSYYFWAEAGQGVVILMADLSDAPGLIPLLAGLEPRVQLYGPDGIRVADSGWDYASAAIEDCPLKMTGVYTIVVSDADGSYSTSYSKYCEYTPDTGDYGLSLAVTGGPTTCMQDRDGGDLTVSRAVNGTLAPGGDTDVYTIFGRAGQSVRIDVTDRSLAAGIVPALGGLEPRVQLYGPDGIRVADSGWGYARATIEDCQLPMTGIYTIVVSDAEGSFTNNSPFQYSKYYEYTPDTGEYGLSVAVMPPNDPHGLYPYGPRPGDGESISFCDPNYQFADVLVENKKLPDGKVVKRVSGAYLLSWWSVIGATSYDVYFAGSPCMPLEKVAANIINPWTPMPAVEGGQVCTWRVVAHTPNGDIKGPTWWFATAPCPFPSCSLTISALGRGSIVDPNAGVHPYSPGAVVPVAAVADPNYEFVRWEGSAVDANKVVVQRQDPRGSQVRVTVDGAYTLRAVFEEVVYDLPLDTDPGWTRNGQWQFGKPTGQGGREYGNPDPTRGHTGQNVLGVNLNGDYNTTIGGPYSLVAGPFDLRGYKDVKLRLWSWLNTDWAEYVKSSLEVSLDQKTWSLAWQNPQRADVADSAWTRVEYDIRSWADGQPKAYLRWSYQIVKERACPYSGWNLDDIQLIGRRQK